MKTFMNFLYLSAVFGLVSMANAQSIPIDVERLVLYDPTYDNSLNDKKWSDAIRTREGIKPILLELIRKEMDESKDWEMLSRALRAIRQIKDLNKEELEAITQRLEDYSRTYDPSKKDQLGYAFICSSIPILSNYPSDYHEKLTLRFLGIDDSMIQNSAVRTLQAIGGSISINEVRSYMESVKPAPGNLNRYYDDALAAYREIERRVDTSRRNDARNSTSSSAAGLEKKRMRSVSERGRQEGASTADSRERDSEALEETKTSWTGIVIAFTVLLAVIFAVRRIILKR